MALKELSREGEEPEKYLELGIAVFEAATCDGVWQERIISWEEDTILGYHTLSHAEFLELQSFLLTWMIWTAENGESMLVASEGGMSTAGRNWLFETISDNLHLEPTIFKRWMRAWVLMKPAEVNLQQFQSGVYPLQLIVGHGDISGVQILLEAGANINAQDEDGKAALHFVSQSSCQVAEKITLLVQNGANVNLVDRLLQSAFHKAVHLCNYTAVITFRSITDKATRREQDKACDIFFQTPFISACSLPLGKNSERIIKFLLADGCDPDTQQPGRQEPGMGKLILRKEVLCVGIRWGGCAAEIKIPIDRLENFVCKDASVIPGGCVNDWDAFFRRFLQENNGAIFKTTTRVNDFDIWFTETENGTWPVLFQAHGPFKLRFSIPPLSRFMQFYRQRNRGYTAAHHIIDTASQQQGQSPIVIRIALKKLHLLYGLCNPLVVCVTGKTVAYMFAELVKKLGADWLVDNALATPQLYTTISNHLPMVLHANVLLQQENEAKNSILLSQHKRVGMHSGLLILGPEMLQKNLDEGMLRHTV